MNKCKLTIIGGVLIVAWLLLANQCMGTLYNVRMNVDVQTGLEIEDYDLLPTRIAVDRIQKEENLFDTINITGWVVAPGSPAEKIQTVRLALSSVSKAYTFSTNVEPRPDIKDLFKQMGFSDIGEYHGFNISFSPYVIKDGEYRVYLLCLENDRVVGVEDSGYCLKKKNGIVDIQKNLRKR